jgi:hypothetical protein
MPHPHPSSRHGQVTTTRPAGTVRTKLREFGRPHPLATLTSSHPPSVPPKSRHGQVTTTGPAGTVRAKLREYGRQARKWWHRRLAWQGGGVGAGLGGGGGGGGQAGRLRRPGAAVPPPRLRGGRLERPGAPGAGGGGDEEA